MAVYLTVPFKDKDIVKALGARWDGKRRQWFVPEYQDATRFARWADKDAVETLVGQDNEEDGEVVMVEGGERVCASLASVLFEISEAVRKTQPKSRWITAEVSNLKVTATGHCYLDLVEHDQTGREVAKAAGRIWSTSGKILKRFEKETGSKLVAGMKVMLLGQPDFSIQYGFGLTIEDIDPSWTLGEMEKKLIELRKRLFDEGLYEKNQSLPFPKDFTKIAIISPDGAAGLGDFMVDAEVLEAAGLCSFKRLTAVFEGASASMSICSALSRAEDLWRHEGFDALVIIRGGGAKTSLNWLNDYDIAASVANFPSSVLTGIGHERDFVILDDMGARRFDTPSKTIGFIASKIIGNAKGAMEDIANIKAEALDRISFVSERLETLRSAVDSEVDHTLADADSFVLMAKKELSNLCNSLLVLAESEIGGMFKEIVGMGPSSTLGRGYAMVRAANGSVVSSVDGVVSGKMGLVFSDGEVSFDASEIVLIKHGEKNE